MADTKLDILITRVLDGRATPDDWAQLESLAERDAGVWRDVATAQRDDRALRAAVACEVARADLIEPDAPYTLKHSAHAMSRRTRLVATWAGWAAAAAAGLALFAQRPAEPLAQPRNPNLAGVGVQQPVLSAADSLADYLARGREEGVVIREVPEKWLLSATPSPDGSRQQVIYLRLIMERTEVPDFYTFSQDEWGNPATARVQIAAPQATATRVRPPV